MKTRWNLLVKTASYLLCCMLAASFSACDCDDNPVEPAPVPNLVGTMVDGGTISKVGLYCLKDEPMYDAWFNYYPKVKTVEDYSDISSLCLLLHDDQWTYTTDNVEEMMAITSLEDAYFKKKSSMIVEAYEQYKASDFYRNADRYHDTRHLWGWPEFFTAYTNGEVAITCDKTLFGEAPGTNLASHFVIDGYQGCMPVGVESPELRYDFFDEQPVMMSECFPMGVWLQHQYMVHFQTYPAEKYDDITLSLTMPLMIEHIRDYAVAAYRGSSQLPQFTEQVFKAACTIKFNR